MRSSSSAPGPAALRGLLGVGRSLNGFGPRPAAVRDSIRPLQFEVRSRPPRIGITKAANCSWRYCLAAGRFVSRPWGPRRPSSAIGHAATRDPYRRCARPLGRRRSHHSHHSEAGVWFFHPRTLRPPRASHRAAAEEQDEEMTGRRSLGTDRNSALSSSCSSCALLPFFARPVLGVDDRSTT